MQANRLHELYNDLIYWIKAYEKILLYYPKLYHIIAYEEIQNLGLAFKDNVLKFS